MLPSDPLVIGAYVTGIVAVLGAFFKGMRDILRAFKALHRNSDKIVKELKLNDVGKTKLDEIDEKANGNYKRMQEMYERLLVKQGESEKQIAQLMAVIGAIRPVLEANGQKYIVDTRLSDADKIVNETGTSKSE